MIEIPACSIRKCAASVFDGAESPYVKGLITIRGQLTAELAPAFHCEGALSEGLPRFEIDRSQLCDVGDEDQAWSIDLLNLAGQSELHMPAVALHRTQVTRGEGGIVYVVVQAAFDSRFGRAVSEFVWDMPGWTGSLRLQPSQAALPFAKSAPDDDEDDDGQEPLFGDEQMAALDDVQAPEIDEDPLEAA